MAAGQDNAGVERDQLAGLSKALLEEQAAREAEAEAANQVRNFTIRDRNFIFATPESILLICIINYDNSMSQWWEFRQALVWGPVGDRRNPGA